MDRQYMEVDVASSRSIYVTLIWPVCYRSQSIVHLRPIRINKKTSYAD